MNSTEFAAALERIQREIGERWDAEKKEVVGGLADRITKAELTERLDSLKSSVNEEVKKLVDDMVKLSHDDPRNRVDLVPTREYAFYRGMAKEAKTREAAMELYHDFLTTHSDNGDVERFQELSSRLAILQLAARVKGKRNWRAASGKLLATRKMWHEYQTLQRAFFPEDFYQRAFDTTAQDEWTPDVLSADLMRYLEVRGAVLPNVRSFALPAALWRVPITVAAGKADGFVENATGAAAYPDYGAAGVYGEPGAASPLNRITFDVGRFRAVLVSSGEFIEESVVPFMEWMIAECMDSIRRAAEDTFFNGDKTSPGLDSDISYAAGVAGGRDNRIIWNGVRWQALQNTNTVDVGSPHSTDLVDFVSAKKKCGRYALEPSDWLWCCSPASYLDLLDLPEFVTVDKIGERATVVTGQIGSVLGSPVVVSEYVRSDVHTTGYHTTTTNASTMIIGFHRPSYWIGNWRGITTETERLAMYNQDVVYAWYAADLQKMRLTTEKTEVVIINIAST